MPKDALLWKLKLLHSAALYTNSRLHAVRAEVLVLARLFSTPKPCPSFFQKCDDTHFVATGIFLSIM